MADQRAWESVLAHVEAQLLDGTLLPGDHLPPERALASDLGVGRSSVREAVRVLEALGLVRTQTGSGPTAGAIIVATPRGGMSALLRLQVAAQGFGIRDVVATRLVLEAAVASELASTRRTDAAGDLTAAGRLLDAMDDPGLTAEEFLALDAQFHVALAEASGNQVIAAMMASLRSSIEGYVQQGLASIDDWPATAARLRDEHRAMLGAIDGGYPSAAAQRVRDHISGYYAQTRLTDRTPPLRRPADAGMPAPDRTPAETAGSRTTERTQ